MSKKIEGEPSPPREPVPEDLALAPPVRLGTILFSLVEPEEGHARAFASWYERDHFFAGCMAGADFFSGRRFVATRDLKQCRTGAGVADGVPIDRGSFLHLYWILEGRREPALAWSVDQVRRLARQGRMGPPTQNVATGFHAYAGGIFSEREAIPAELALEYPYRSVTALLLERAQTADERDFRALIEHHAGAMAANARDMALWFRPIPLPPNAPRIAAPVSRHALDHGWLMLLFSDKAADADALRSLGRALGESGLGTLRLAAPFRPILPGIDDYSARL